MRQRKLQLLERQTKMEEKIKEIAEKYLNIQTLDSRGNDRLDFYSIPVWQLKETLNAAYLAGIFYKENSK